MDLSAHLKRRPRPWEAVKELLGEGRWAKREADSAKGNIWGS